MNESEDRAQYRADLKCCSNDELRNHREQLMQRQRRLAYRTLPWLCAYYLAKGVWVALALFVLLSPVVLALHFLPNGPAGPIIGVAGFFFVTFNTKDPSFKWLESRWLRSIGSEEGRLVALKEMMEWEWAVRGAPVQTAVRKSPQN